MVVRRKIHIHGRGEKGVVNEERERKWKERRQARREKGVRERCVHPMWLLAHWKPSTHTCCVYQQ